MSGPARTGTRARRARLLAAPVALLLGVGLLGSAPAACCARAA